jgi:LCP family protein required for cell wall assembly
VPGYGMAKINAAFSIGAAKGGDSGGAQLLVTVVQNMTGLTIDHYVRVSLLGFYNIVNALGPVQVCLNHAVNDPYSGINLPAGESTLNAQQALAFVRQRHGLAGGDLDREIRQQYFLSIEARSILSAGTLLNPVKLHNVLNAVSSSIETDPGLNLPNLAAQVKGFAGHLSSVTIPILGTPTIVVNHTYVSIVQVNTAALPAFFSNIVHPKKVAKVAAVPSPASISLTVLNGRQVPGAAGAASTALTKAGFKVGRPADAIEQQATTINYPKGDEAKAAVVVSFLPGSKAVLTAGLTQIQVVLGADALQVNSASGTAAATPSGTSTDPTTEYSPASCIN